MATWSQRGLESVEFLPIVRWRANHYHWWDSAHHPRPVPTLSTLTETMEPLSMDPIQRSRYNIFVMNETGDGVDGETGGRWQSRDQTTLHHSSPPQTSHLLTELLQYRGLQFKCFQTMCIMKSSPSSSSSSSQSTSSSSWCSWVWVCVQMRYLHSAEWHSLEDDEPQSIREDDSLARSCTTCTHKCWN